MNKKCKCGYITSDTIIPNHTSLRLFINDPKYINAENSGEDHTLVFHCECCHRLHFYPSKTMNLNSTFCLSDTASQKSLEISEKSMPFYIKNDYDEVFKGFIDAQNSHLYVDYHGRKLFYTAEKSFNIDCFSAVSKKIFTFPYENNQAVISSKTRCVCGWMINKELIDNESIINLYNTESLEQRIKYEFGEKNNYFQLKGICCEKCNRLLLPDTSGEYRIYSSITELNSNNKYELLFYYVKAIDEYKLDFDNIENTKNRMNKIFISDDKKYLVVHHESNIFYYASEQVPQ